MKYALVAAALLAAGCAATPAPAAEDLDPANLQIEIGRWGYMLSQVADMPADASLIESDPAQRVALARDLRETVWSYNLQRSRSCAAGRLPQVSCGAAFTPAWLAEAPNAEPSLADISARSRAVGDRVMAYWDAFCAQARAKLTDEDARAAVCPME